MSSFQKVIPQVVSKGVNPVYKSLERHVCEYSWHLYTYIFILAIHIFFSQLTKFNPVLLHWVFLPGKEIVKYYQSVQWSLIFNQKDGLFDARANLGKAVYVGSSVCLPHAVLRGGEGFSQHMEGLKEALFFFFMVKEQAPPCSKNCRTIYN